MTRHFVKLASIFFVALAMLWFLVDSQSDLRKVEADSPSRVESRRGKIQVTESHSSSAKFARPSSAAFSTQIRSPASEGGDGIVELEGESKSRWNFKMSVDGYVLKMTEGSLSLGVNSADEAARIFLARFGKKVFGIEPSLFGVPEINAEESTTQAIISQTLNGLPVHGARTNLIFDSHGNLIYVVAGGYRGNLPPKPAPLISSEQAAKIARLGLLHYLSENGASYSSYPLELFRGKGILMYRLVGDSVSLVYRYEFSLEAPLIGDMEIMIDAMMGSVVLVRNQTRK